MSLRTEAGEEAYLEAQIKGRLTPLNNEPKIKYAPEFIWWRVIENKFPYDRHHTKHDLVVLKRECDFSELSLVEIMELFGKILPWANGSYDKVSLNLQRQRSIHGVPHFHLLNLKQKYR